MQNSSHTELNMSKTFWWGCVCVTVFVLWQVYSVKLQPDMSLWEIFVCVRVCVCAALSVPFFPCILPPSHPFALFLSFYTSFSVSRTVTNFLSRSLLSVSVSFMPFLYLSVSAPTLFLFAFLCSVSLLALSVCLSVSRSLTLTCMHIRL